MDAVTIHQVGFRENETFLKSFTDGPKGDKGQLFLEIDLPDNPGAEDALAGKLWRALHDTFFNCKSDDPYFCFEEALKAANEVIDQENKKRETGTIGRLHALAALLDNGTLHFSQAGHATVYLGRGDYFAAISEALDPDADISFSSISSGELSDEDVLVFASRALPFDNATLSETFSDKASKIDGHLKALAKKKEITGSVSYWMMPAAEEAPVVAPEQEMEPDMADEMIEEEDMDDELPEPKQSSGKRAGKAGKALASLGKKIKIKGDGFEKVKETFSGVVGGVSHKLSKIVKKPDHIKNVNRRYILLAVIGIVVILGILLSVQSTYRENARQAEYYEDLLSQVKNNISTAENRFLIGEKTDATEFLNKAATALDEIEAAGFFQADVEKKKEEIQLYRDNFDAIIRAEDPSVLADLSTKGTVDALGLITTEDQKNYVYEPKRLFETLLDKVQEPLNIDQEEIVISGAELVDFNVLTFITHNGQVIEYETRNGRFTPASTQDDTWKRGVDIATFNGEFIYLLDPPSSSIWKYRRLRSGYSTSSAYNTEGDLSNAVSLAIDGEVYVLNKDGSVIKFNKGAIVDFEMRDNPSIPIKSASQIFTLPEHNHIYILESGMSRVVVYSKGDSGVSFYQKQVVFSTIGANEIRDFSVDKDEQKLTVVTPDKVYITDL